MYDIVGDIHGYAETLERLLKTLGYKEINGVYKHPSRKIIFVGDFVDRGPDILRVLEIAKNMTDAGEAYAVMGNHEYNYIGLNTYYKDGKPVKEHSKTNISNTRETEIALSGKGDIKTKYIRWMKSLPLFLEFEKFRVIHACWDFEYIEKIKNILPNARINDKFLRKAGKEQNKEHKYLRVLLNGKVIVLPKGLYYIDKDGHKRRIIRYKWWMEIEQGVSYREIAVNYEAEISNTIIPDKIFGRHKPYTAEEKPVFVGHYWQRGTPGLLSTNVCCVDYGLGKCKKLVAYRYNGEQKLSDDNFVYLNCEEK